MLSRHSTVLQEDILPWQARLHTYQLAGKHRGEVDHTIAAAAYAVALAQHRMGSGLGYSPRSFVHRLQRPQLQTAAEPHTVNMPLEPDSAVPLQTGSTYHY